MKINTDLLEIPVRNLRKSGTRTFLTLIGVIIGIAAIVSLLSIGQGLNVAVEKQFESLGTNTIFVIPGGASRGLSTIKLTDSDISQLENVRGVSTAVPVYGAAAIMEYNGKKMNVQVSAADGKKSSIFESTGYFDVQEGRTFSKNDSDAVLIGDKIAHTYFDRNIIPRKIITLNGQQFTVIGILKPQAQSFGGGPNTGTSIFMSLEAFNRIAKDIYPSIIFVKTFSPSDVNYAVTAMKDILEKKYGKKSITISSADELLNQVNSILGLITLVVAGIGGISLLVGGIGIMNAMITAVLERTREIGLMKALGASNTTVLLIFIIEAGLIGLIGGIIGVLIGYGLSIIISTIGSGAGFALTAVISTEITVGGIIFAMIIGIASGLLPAIRAANLDPVIALRYE
ncbi:MAG: ABC transporter permease [archaeon]|jgi:putative ABC transport system permease protein